MISFKETLWDPKLHSPASREEASPFPHEKQSWLFKIIKLSDDFILR